MTLSIINSKISTIESEIEKLNTQLEEICKYRDIRTTEMPQEYYRVLKEKQKLESELRPLFQEHAMLRQEKEHKEEEGNNNNNINKKTFVNSFGEATKREIESLTYRRQQKRLEQTILCNLSI